METLDRSQLEFLAQRRGRFCVSMFLPTHRAGPETRQDPIRLKNLTKEAESRLVAAGVRPAKAREQLSAARDLARRTGFWRSQRDGLAVFVSPGLFQYFRLPLVFQESVFVADRFEVSPLIPHFLVGRRFRVLALSHNHVRFFDGTPTALVERDIAGVPHSVEEALKYDVRESQLQMHSGARGSFAVAGVPRGSAGKAAAVYTGQGVGVDDEQKRTLQFLLQVERGIRRQWRDQQVPLILAAVTELQSAYRSVNRYGRLLDSGVVGNPDLLGPEQLHKSAWEVAGPYFNADRQKAFAKYQELASTDKRSSDLREILTAAYQGRIESLFLRVSLQRWGKFEFEEGTFELHDEPRPDNEDLFNVVAVQTILSRGEVYSTSREQIPDHQELAAVFRFSTKPAGFSVAQTGQP